MIVYKRDMDKLIVEIFLLPPEKFHIKKMNIMLGIKKIIMKESISFGIGIVSVHKIDKINVLNASFLAMHRAIEKIQHKYDLLLIDGNRFNKYKNKRHKCIVKGDSKFMNIAAASILAKTHRDNIMKNLALEFPKYFCENL